jgi:hypothetical protein
MTGSAADATTVCEIAPPWLQFENVKRVPGCCTLAATATVCVEPAVHWKLAGAVADAPSTVTGSPAGFVLTVTVTVEGGGGATAG